MPNSIENQLLLAMIDYYNNDPKRINHFIKVHSFTKLICDGEKINSEISQTLSVASIVHDIGIKKSEEKYSSSSGYYQEIEGPDESKKLLKKLNINDAIIDRCGWLIANHHTYNHIIDIDHQILVEADFLVNIYEDNISKDSIKNIKSTIFKTTTGLKLLKQLYNI